MPSPERGSSWGIWDLHVHTPASHEHGYGDRQDEGVWERFIKELEALPSEVRVLGVNDYLHIEGYKRLLEAKDQGRLPNIELMLPMVELRVDRFGGQKYLSRVNYHVVFSDELSPDEIEGFFVKRLMLDLDFGGGESYRGGASTDRELEEIGRAYKRSTPPEKRPAVSDIKAGFGAATYNLESVRELLDTTLFRGKVLVGLGLNEWKDLRWDGTGGAQKKDIACRSDFLLVASPTPEGAGEHRSRLVQEGIETPLLHASDAHFWSGATQPNRIGTAWGWVKALPTFDGLRQALRRPAERTFVGVRPPKEVVIRSNRTKFLNRVRIQRMEGASLDEVWFSVDIPVNGDLVAVIGNQGEGKSALMDSIALAANAHTEHYSFLNEEKFCDPKDKKAASFTATLVWADGSETTVNLAEAPDRTQVERVRYVPQSFFEKATNEKEVAEGGLFYAEVKRAVFSHVPQEDRLGHDDFDALVAAKTAAATGAADQLRGELADLNRRVALLEAHLKPEVIRGLRSKLAQKTQEIESLRRNPPPVVPPPPADEDRDRAMQDVLDAEGDVRGRYQVVGSEIADLKQRRQALTDVQSSVNALERETRNSIGVIRTRLLPLGIESPDVVTFSVDQTPITDALEAVEKAIQEANGRKTSVAEELGVVLDVKKDLTEKMAGAAKAYAEYEERRSEWEAGIELQVGDAASPDTQRYLEEQIRRIQDDLPKALDRLRDERWETFGSIHGEVLRQAEAYQELTAPVREFVENDSMLSERYSLGVGLTVSANGLAEGLFRFIGKKRGSFRGSDKGPAAAARIVNCHDAATLEGARALVEDVLDNLNKNHNQAPPTEEDLDNALANGATRADLYDFLFGMEYLAPRYELTLAGDPLSRLSPGERGVLLLVFYLVVDRGGEPLIIDQPEGNLNNQSIYESLVPVFRAAKERRQVIIVTHNPNLAVVCDAEQVIAARRHRTEGNRLEYVSGALEDVDFRSRCLDLLEGTAAAFEVRQSAYFDLL